MTFSRTVILLLSHTLVAAAAIMLWPSPLEPKEDKTPPSPNALAQPLFRVGERYYAYDNLPREYRRPLFEIRNFAFQQQLPLIEDALVEAYIQQRMSEQKADRITIQNQLMPGAEPSEAEILEFYEQNQSQSAPPLEQIRDDLYTYLTAARQEKMKKELLTRLLVEGKAQVLAEAPISEK